MSERGRPEHPRHRDGEDRHHDKPHRHHHGRGRRRLFDYGELRLLLLAMIGAEPSHGYELIKQIEERMGGAYSPSPGVIYPTLSWLEDMGYAAVEPIEGGRKRYSITAEGLAHLEENRALIEELQSRTGTERDGAEPVPAPLIRAMESLKIALRLRIRSGPIDAEAAQKIADALDNVVRLVETAER